MIDTRAAKSRANLAGQMDMFSMMDGADDTVTAPKALYPDVPPYSLRERLMLEREVSGMFFSGQLLDDYCLCVNALDPRLISEIVPTEDTADAANAEDGEHVASLLPDRTKVKLAGIVTSVTVKMTKKEERMAFFTLEDAGGAIECLAFPKVYEQSGDLIRQDSALFVEGNVSVRDEESPKILVSTLGLLVDNDHFSQAKAQAAPPKPTPVKAEPISAASEPSRSVAGQGSYGYNPYDDVPSPPKPTPTATPSVKVSAPAPSPTKIYLRVPDLESEVYLKTKNLVDIFNEGTVAVTFFSEREGKYAPYAMRLRLTPFVQSRFEALLGKENVVVK